MGYPLGSGYVRQIRAAEVTHGGFIQDAVSLLQAIRSSMRELVDDGLLKIDFAGITSGSTEVVTELIDYYGDFITMPRRTRYILLENLSEHLRRIVSDSLKSLDMVAVCLVDNRLTLLGNPSDVAVRIVGDLVAHGPICRVVDVAERLGIHPNYASDQLAKAFRARIIGRTWARTMPSFLRTYFPPLLSRVRGYRGYAYFPLWYWESKPAMVNPEVNVVVGEPR